MKRVNLSIAEKLELIKKVESGVSVARVCVEYGVKKQTVSDIRKAKDKLRENAVKFNVDANSFELTRASVFQQDGAPAHTAKSVTQWLDDCMVPFIKDWPGNSLDLNPIENLWHIGKKDLQGKDVSSIPKLVKAILLAKATTTGGGSQTPGLHPLCRKDKSGQRQVTLESWSQTVGWPKPMQAWQLTCLLQEGTGETDNGVLSLEEAAGQAARSSVSSQHPGQSNQHNYLPGVTHWRKASIIKNLTIHDLDNAQYQHDVWNKVIHGLESETIEHFLLQCPRFHSHRVVLHSQLLALNITTFDLPTLLAAASVTPSQQHAVIRLTCAFLRKTRWLLLVNQVGRSPQLDRALDPSWPPLMAVDEFAESEVPTYRGVMKRGILLQELSGIREGVDKRGYQ
ncbi:Transposable element Tcb2 transposase [Chionoecetes opilio]|uniref:Transposable element Tcb2 transposase n=1 Tax=Chionoecetes opilio TaxID=41210 RepID=A0A8J5CZ66_CHIOP|nr:Transposable element Tcb2 transposase [Chionoecetes opilio]